jgi:hypothetical protein
MNYLDEYIRQGLQLDNARNILEDVAVALVGEQKRDALDMLTARIHDFLKQIDWEENGNGEG